MILAGPIDFEYWWFITEADFVYVHMHMGAAAAADTSSKCL